MQKVKHFFSFFTVFFLIIIIPQKRAEGALTSVTLSGLPTLTNMSDGRGYFLASGNTYTYNFDISIVNPGAGSAASYDYFRITIPTQTGNIIVTWNSDGAGADVTGVTPAGAGTLVGGAGVLISGTWDNGTVRLTVRFYWPSEATLNANRTITAEVQDTASNNMTDTKSLTYGICSDIRVLNFQNDTPESDGLILPVNRASAFTVSGRLIYDIPGYSSETVSDVVADADLTSVTLELRNRDNNALYWTHGTPVAGSNTLSYTIQTTDNFPARTQGYYWQVQADFAGAGSGANEYSPADNRVPLESNYVIVTNIEFIGGIGRGPTHPAPDNISSYYREYGNAGTQIKLTVRMYLDSGSGIAMQGNTTFTVEYTDGTNTGSFTCTINNGETQGTAVIEYDNTGGFLNTWLTSGTTELWTYRINGISGSSYGNQAGDGNGDYGNSNSTVSATIRWDRDDPPGNGQPAIQRISPTATSLTIYWNPIATVTSDSSGPYEEDFYEYRIYFKEASDTGPFKVWDGDDDPMLRTLANNPSTIPASSLGFDANGWKYTIIPDLKIYTRYKFYITAVDVFGNETVISDPENTDSTIVRTQPYSIEITVSDGITKYTNDSFADLTPAVRSLREANIKVEISIITSEELPETVKLWYTTGDISTSPDIVNTSTNTVNSGAFPANTLFSSEAQKTGPNKWVAFLQTTSGIIKAGNSIRFIVESSLNNVSSFTDSEIEASPNQNPNDDEWTLYISRSPKLKPWPVRVLNNVITDKNPAAYPAYYLSEDADVTIRVYDIRGRAVATILDRAFRRGGQNIKEQGWRGINKARKKLGPGLYYIHFQAKSVRNGKVILNKFRKVVVAR